MEWQSDLFREEEPTWEIVEQNEEFTTTRPIGWKGPAVAPHAPWLERADKSK